MIGHKAVSPNRKARLVRLFGQQIAIDFLVARFEENGFATVAALGHVVGEARDDDAGEARHGGLLGREADRTKIEHARERSSAVRATPSASRGNMYHVPVLRITTIFASWRPTRRE